MSLQSEEQTFVLVVGGGPVGLSAAIDLAWHGVPTLLVNERLQTARHPKCNMTNARSMEHFRRLRLTNDIRKSGFPPAFTRENAYVTRFCGREFGRLVRPAPALASGGASSADFAQSSELPQLIPQTRLEPVLKAHAERALGANLRFGIRLVEFTQDDAGVHAVVEDVTTNRRSTVHAHYLIGADGASSAVRRALDVSLKGSDGTDGGSFMSGTMLSFFIRAPNLLQRSGRTPAAISWIVNNEMRGFVFAQDGRQDWIVHYQVPRDIDYRDLDGREIVAKMLGSDVAFEIMSGGPWTGGLALVADRYRHGRIFLAGDAAHLFTPLGGLGMNTGIGDVMNLGWKLAALHQGWGGERLLTSYEAERRPIGLRNSLHGIRIARKHSAWRIPADIEDDGVEADAHRREFGAFCVEDDRDQYSTAGIQFGERYDDSPIVVADEAPTPEDTWYTYTPLDRPGARMPHFTLPDGRGAYDALGRGLTLFAFDASADTFRDAAADTGIPLDIVEVPGALPNFMTSRLVLARPDMHAAWHGSAAPPSPHSVLTTAAGRGV